MKTSILKLSAYLLLITTFSCIQNANKETAEVVKVEAPKFTEDWESLGKHNESPEWFKDAKLGIYFHWGLYSVPAFGNEWYPRWMHFEDNKFYKHHVENYGHPSEFGYHDFAPMFKAEKFDPDAWAKLFKDAGAQFAGPVAEHHDGYAMWDSEITPWNTMDTGPKRDITGDLEKAIKGNGLKFITAFHHAKNLQRATELGQDVRISHFPNFEGMPPTSDDPKLQLMYGNMEHEKWYKDVWLGKMKEVIDNYHPDIIWFDYVLGDIPEVYRKEFAAYYLNEAAKKDQEAVIVRKQHDMPLNMSVEDLEQSRKNKIGTKTWMTDATISNGSWCYTKDLGVKESADVLHMLIDIVSKNGVLLLNVSPKADGTIPENQTASLLEMGQWLKSYGEAIYGTEAWYTFGEGPTKEPDGHYKNHQAFHKLKYSNKDIRYTTKDYNIYAIVMGEVEANKELLLESFAKENVLDMTSIEKVEFMGSGEAIEWSLSEEKGLSIKAPSKPVEEMATVIKITISQ
ncbi:alpha-L-fucosidase [Seonamhaeicola maritimus]|uniref:alpha-L-fucosidase n=1 Tax=Seonamhaeicola maritimus TaxID=2591822 RepID=A0A5C7GJW1_9FLAO|nr:alpha-L-fucosidase [Seonamhaeicola maritimus]TXG38427.1 alpha-L-fucosidase [Seonamhaeicola maritimus]